MSRDSTRAPHIGGVEHEPTARYPVITAQLRVRFRIPRSWAERPAHRRGKGLARERSGAGKVRHGQVRVRRPAAQPTQAEPSARGSEAASGVSPRRSMTFAWPIQSVRGAVHCTGSGLERSSSATASAGTSSSASVSYTHLTLPTKA